MPKIQITSKGIRAALKKYTPHQSIAEYVWNGFDAQASTIKISFNANELGNIETISISDNGYGIPHAKLQEKFEPLFESKKALENKLKKNLSAIHGKNGIGRLTFFTFARNATWKTVYTEDAQRHTYEIYANAENINLYTGINAISKITDDSTGTTVTFSGIYGLNASQMDEKFQEYLLKEFAWFLALNEKRDFSIEVNGVPLNYKLLVADSEEFELVHEKTATTFSVSYIRWNQRSNNEASRYYYINTENKERWKEPTAIKNKGEQFYHSLFIKSSYFDEFGFQTSSGENQPSLISGTRMDAQFRFLRKKLANILRIKRRPFLKGFADQLLIEYEQKNIIASDASEKLKQSIKILYEMQPRIFSSLNLEQRKMLVGLLKITIESNASATMPEFIATIIELTSDEKNELNGIFCA